MPNFPNYLLISCKKMRVFAGNRRHFDVATPPQRFAFIYRGEFSPSLSTSRRSGLGRYQRGISAMRIIRPIARLASAAAIACSAFAFGWVGLALLGF
jgi:hypothetical protein